MTEVEADERGRITIPKQLRETYGESYRIVELREGIKLIPIPENPIEALRDSASEELRSASMKELKEAAHREARKQAGR